MADAPRPSRFPPPAALRHLAAPLAAVLLAAPLEPLAAEVEGRSVAEVIVLEGSPLRLNGAGLRTKEVLANRGAKSLNRGSSTARLTTVKVYVGALYLPRKMTDAAAIVALDEPKAMRLTFLRDLERSTVLGILRVGFESNSKEHLSELLPRLRLLGPALPETIREGQTLSIAYRPARGSTVAVDGEAAVTVEGKDFADALFRTWLGPNPADDGLEKLRKSLLGE